MTFFLGFLCLMALLNYFTAIRMEKVRIRETANRISLLIPLRNEGSRVTELLNNLAKLSSSNVEIILLNDESTDDTWEKLQKSTDKEIRAIQGEPLPEGGWENLGRVGNFHKLLPAIFCCFVMPMFRLAVMPFKNGKFNRRASRGCVDRFTLSRASHSF